MATIDNVFNFWKAVNQVTLIRMEEQAMCWNWLNPVRTQWNWFLSFVPDSASLTNDVE